MSAQKAESTSYDEVPYDATGFSYTTPVHFYSIGRLFGLKPADPAKARVLDLGCAFGTNIMGPASLYPEAKFVGVDLSKKQIEVGQKQIKDLGLKNIEIKAMSILDIDKSFGEFDYIICHGVFSWVPKEVQDKILQISKENLSENGVMQISYNTLPGWNIARTFREMMTFHAGLFTDTKDKIFQARSLLDFVKDSLEDSNSPYSDLLKIHADHIAECKDNYVLHEYLEQGNSEFYFSDFMSKASDHGLQYLADSILPSMYMDNLPPKASKKLSEISNIIRAEQYRDFVSNRRFRNTLLCKNSQEINRNLDLSSINDAFLYMHIVHQTPLEEVDFENFKEPVDFVINNNTNCNVREPAQAAIFYVLCDEKKFIKWNDLFSKAKKIYPKLDVKKDAERLSADLLDLLFKGLLKIHFAGSRYTDKLSKKPKLHEFGRYQAMNNFGHCANCENDFIPIDDSRSFIFSQLDGKNTKSDVEKKFGDWMQKTGKKLYQNGKTVTDEKLRNEIIADIVESQLQLALTYGFLIE